MKTLEQIDLTEAVEIFAVANTPNFLIRKLRDNPAVRLIHSTFKGNEILQALKTAVSQEPRTLLDSVRPYVYLVALSFNPNISYLKRAAIIATPHFDWFAYAGNVLIKSYQPTSILSFDVPLRPMELQNSFKRKPSKTQTPTTRFILPDGN